MTHRIETDLDAAIKDLDRVHAAIAGRDANGYGLLERVALSFHGQPRAAAYDRDTASPHPRHDGRVPELDDQPPRPDPTGEAAVRGRDRAAADWEHLLRTTAAIRKSADQLVRLAMRYQARPPSEAERLELERLNAQPEPGCEWCAAAEVAPGVQRWEPVHQRMHLGTTEDGDELRAGLCAWCCRFFRTTGAKPSAQQLADHHSGKRVKLVAPRSPRQPADA